MADEIVMDEDEEIYGFWMRAAAEPGRRLLVEPDGTEHHAGELAAASNRLVHGLRDLGLARGDVVAVYLPNCAEVVELLMATQQGGWYLVPINHHLKPAEAAYIVGDSGAKAFVTHARYADVALEVAALIDLPPQARFAVGAVDGFRPYTELRDPYPADAPEDRAAGLLMTYTSGTSGRPKGVKRPLPEFDPDLQGEVQQIANTLFGLGDAGGVHLVTGPMYHTAVIGLAMSALHAGNAVVLMDDWEPEQTLRLIERYRVSTTHMVPTMFNRLLKLPAAVRERYDLSSLTQVTHGAAPCPVPVKHEMIRWFGPVISEYYAATEGGGTLVSSLEWLERPGTVGRPWQVSRIKITDDDGRELPPGEVGTIWIGMMVGGIENFEYHGDAGKTSLTFDADGNFTVGDVGYLDDDGYLYICDRKIDMIISGGVNIYPAEVESVLAGHPAVLDVAVFGVPDEDWGEQVKAAVELADGFTPSGELEQDLIAYAREHIAHLKCPRSIDFGPLPRDPNGKVFKRVLADPYWQGRDRRV
ncbi:MAG TPA: acyl-CoA synthetase [Egibacteraceae bacterium]|nr:acyl-CoA synthetase [Egibacteraceae bacterium]